MIISRGPIAPVGAKPRKSTSPGWAQRAKLQRAAAAAANDAVHAYRISKLADGIDLLLHLGPARLKVVAAEKVLATRIEGKQDAARGRKEVAEAREFIAALQAHADRMSSPRRGVMDGQWLHGWTVHRTLSGPLDRIERTLVERSPDPERVTIVDHGTTSWHITMPPDGGLSVQFAGAQLQSYIRRMSACQLPVSTERREGSAIVIDLRENLDAADRALLSPPAAGYDGYAMAVRGGVGQADRIVIGGDNERGVLYGVYDLLEQLGCRWFYPTQDPDDPEVVPNRSTLAVDVGAARWPARSSIGSATAAPGSSRWIGRLPSNNSIGP